jgi:polyhydroxyalkanoate synthesis repressor PhaR
MNASQAKVTIKKYANRRLYDTESSTYVTLDRLAVMIREGRDFQVIDAKSGDDITHQVLTQIIVEEEARGSTMLPAGFLRQLIGLYGNSMQGMVPQYLETAMDSFKKNGATFGDSFGASLFADIAKRNMAMFEQGARALTNVAGVVKPAASPPQSAKPSAAAPSATVEVDALRAELDALRAKVDRLGR